MNILTYILAAVFVLAGAMKMMQPKTKLETKMAWVKDVSSWQVKAIATLEALAALALALPLIFDTGLILVPLAATGLVFLMLGAVFTHARLKGIPMIAIPAVLGVLALWVAIWGYTDLIS
jgi:predicted membrane channel-forming protein YqfA (hemolysin III family)